MIKEIKSNGRYALLRKDFDGFVITKDGVAIKRYRMGSRDKAYEHYDFITNSQPDEEEHVRKMEQEDEQREAIAESKRMDKEGVVPEPPVLAPVDGVPTKQIITDKGTFVYKPDIGVPMDIYRMKGDAVMYVSKDACYYVVKGDKLYYGGDIKKEANHIYWALCRERAT